MLRIPAGGRVSHWSLLITVHALAATFAVGVGGYLLARRRKGDGAHRRLGRVWMATMYFVVLSSFGIKRLHPGHFSWIHLLSLWTFVSLTVALTMARRRRVRQHAGWVIGTYSGLIGAGLAAVAFPQRLVPQTLIHRPLVIVAAVAGVVTACFATITVTKRVGRGHRAMNARTLLTGTNSQT
jgi:uncharacterized membrane protein